MRNELAVDGLIVTSDNSAAIGEKPLDAVHVPDFVAAKFAGRVALAEQWAAGAEVSAVILHNFSGERHWANYAKGLEELFAEMGTPLPPLAGSTESNMETLQSGVAVTMIGRKVRELKQANALSWFVYGTPLVGKAVMEQAEHIADMGCVKRALDNGTAHRIWPVGSRGIAHEAEKLFGRPQALAGGLAGDASAGPATCLLIGVERQQVANAVRHFNGRLRELFD